jgi:hypothetical protein
VGGPFGAGAVDVLTPGHRGPQRSFRGVVVWDPPAAERLVIDLLPAARRSIDAERAAGTPLSEAVRTRRFAERVRREVLGETTRQPFPGLAG